MKKKSVPIRSKKIIPDMYEWCLSSYSTEVERYLKSKENGKQFHFQSPQLSHRQDLIQFLRRTVEKFKLSTVVLHLCVTFLDQFMDNHSIISDKLKSVALTCLLIAAKYEERDELIPRTSDLAQLCESSSPTEMNLLEVLILKHLEWNLGIPTAAHFIEYYVLFVLIKNDRDDFKTPHNLLQPRLVNTMLHYLDLSLSEVTMWRFKASQVAAACILSARVDHYITPIWSCVHAVVTGYSYIDLFSCLSIIQSCNPQRRKRKQEELVDQGYESMSPLSSKSKSSPS